MPNTSPAGTVTPAVEPGLQSVPYVLTRRTAHRRGGSPAIEARYPALVPGVLLAGLGMGLVFPVMFAAAITGIPPEHAGIASITATYSPHLTRSTGG
ncbi:hypothetical protein [Dactylosporangium sp. CA-233914]|uniref:hypothetical protein n=1 Tax=Dactylosporangium sp. CA-233914 TaxID=3239934 RepID=UPI003D8E3D0A